MLACDDKNSVSCEVGQDFINGIAYSAYGHGSSEQPVTTRLGYNGELREMQTDWYLLGNGYRAFNPLLMRFHNPDSWSPFGEGGLNAYMYCLGNPIRHTDPTGHMPWGKAVKSIVELASEKLAKNTARVVAEEAAVNTVKLTSTAGNAASSAGRLAGSHADTVTKSVSNSIPSASAYDVIESIPQHSTSARAPTPGSTRSWVSHANIESGPVYSKAEAVIDHSKLGQMPLSGSSKSTRTPVQAQPKPKPKPVQAPNSKPKQTAEERVNAIREKEKKAGNRFN